MAKPTSDMNDLVDAATEMVMATQTATLRVLEVEMQALAQLLPGANHTAQQHLPTEAEVEQGFENMPV